MLPEKINYTLKKSRLSKRLRIIVHSDASVVVTMPKYLSQAEAERFINTNIEWIKQKIHQFKSYNRNIVKKDGQKLNYKLHKKEAEKIILKKLAQFNSYYNFKFNRVVVKNQSSCWGSCSAKKNLNFNYQIAFLEEPLLDYIIVHELCHLGQLNHSKKFWRLVAETTPNFKENRNALRKYSIK